MDFLKTAFYFISILSILVLVHEWGHYIVAKMCKMRVEDFSLFFGKVIWKLGERDGTVYNVRSVPLGGFVKISGMEPDDISNGSPIFKSRKGEKNQIKTLRGFREEALQGIALENVSQRIRDIVNSAVGPEDSLTEMGRNDIQLLINGASINADEHRYLEAIQSADMMPIDPDGYNQKPIWQRALTIFAGPFMSFTFGYFLLCLMGFTTGLPNITVSEEQRPAVIAVVPEQRADKAKIKSGDKILAINGTPVKFFKDMVTLINSNPEKTISLEIQRKQENLSIDVTPEKRKADGKGVIGVYPDMVWERYSPMTAIAKGTDIILYSLEMTFKNLFSKKVKENVGGPIAIVGTIHYAGKDGFGTLILMAALLSVSLGIMNMLPIPVLDGGHLLLLGIEFVRRKRLSSREVYAAQMVGISIIGLLFIFVTYNDIMRWIIRK